MLSILIPLLLTLNVIVALLIILVVLMQRPKNEGLGAAFGGGMTENLFGAQTTNVLAKVTRWLGGIFFVNSLVLTYLYSNFTNNQSSIDQRLRESAPPAAQSKLPPPPPNVPLVPEGAPATSAPVTEPVPVPAVETPAAGVTPAPAAPVPELAPAVPATEPAPAPAASAPVQPPMPAGSPAAPAPAP